MQIVLLTEPGLLPCTTLQDEVTSDEEIVKLLLDAGADPYLENEMGVNVFNICEMSGPFPNVMRLLNNEDYSSTAVSVSD